MKIKFKGTHATIRWNHPMEKEFFKMKMVEMRDSDPKMHPPMYVKDESNKEVLRPKPPIQMVPKTEVMKQEPSIIVNPAEVKIIKEAPQ